MIWWCTVCYGGVLYVMVVSCVLVLCTVCYGGELCVTAVYCTLGWCTVCYGGTLCAVYCMLWPCTVW